MEYVMVPVPEEHVQAVENYLKWDVGRPKVELGDPDELRNILSAFDVTARETLVRIAETTLDGTRPELHEVIEKAGLTEREFVGMITEVNFMVNQHLGTLGIVMLQPDTRPLPEGRSEFAHKIVVMATEVAEQILG